MSDSANNIENIVPVMMYWHEGYYFKTPWQAAAYMRSRTNIDEANRMLHAGHTLSEIGDLFPERFNRDEDRWDEHGICQHGRITAGIDHLFSIPRLMNRLDTCLDYKWRIYRILNQPHDGQWRFSVYSEVDNMVAVVDGITLKLSQYSCRPLSDKEGFLGRRSCLDLDLMVVKECGSCLT